MVSGAPSSLYYYIQAAHLDIVGRYLKSFTLEMLQIVFA